MDWQTLPPLNSLRAFAAVAEHRGFSQAGRALNVSHAAVSQQVRALERRLGAGLVMREGRGLTLTPAGARLARALDNAFGEIALAVERLSDHPLARAVVEGATDIPDVPEATDVEAIVGHGVKARIDAIATAIRFHAKTSDLVNLELAYAPPFGAPKDPVNLAGCIAENIRAGLVSFVRVRDLEKELQAGARVLDVLAEDDDQDCGGPVANVQFVRVDHPLDC